VESFTKQYNDTTRGRLSCWELAAVRIRVPHPWPMLSFVKRQHLYDGRWSITDGRWRIHSKWPCKLTVRLNIVYAVSELLYQQPMSTTLTLADFKVLDELTEDLKLVTAFKRSLYLPPTHISVSEWRTVVVYFTWR